MRLSMPIYEAIQRGIPMEVYLEKQKDAQTLPLVMDEIKKELKKYE